MIQVNHLTKIYNKDDRSVVALNNVSFTLEDTGFVFVTGKSGCGKSTLLNILGGLDNATSGEILFNGTDLASFTTEEYDNYRNSYLGFIFQDYCLIDDLNVSENILLALNLQGAKMTKEEQDDIVDKALISVDLDTSLKRRYVRELSGGQKQRVAIARALIKSPKLILADEPTGNLDSRTSVKILKLLKKLSRDRLVIIVSHNLDDAKTYADRIIELSDGMIISDVSRQGDVEDKVVLSRGVLSLPYSKQLTNRELQEINDKLKHNKIRKIRQASNGFRKTKAIEYVTTDNLDLEKKRMTFARSMALSKSFMKKRKFASVFTIVIISVLVFVLGLAQFLMQFNAAMTTSSVLQKNNENDLLLYNGYYNENNTIMSNRCIEFTEEQIAEFENSGYSGNIFKLYVNTLSFGEHFSDAAQVVPTNNFDKYYIRETRGTLQCNEEYLVKRFGKDGVLEYVGELTDKECGIIITDYIADSIMNVSYKKKVSYESMVGNYVAERRYINAIIMTDYKERYADLFQYMDDTYTGINRKDDEKLYAEKMNEFAIDVQKYYGIAYSINPDFGTALKTEEQYEHTHVNFAEIVANNISISIDSIVVYKENTFEFPISYDKVFPTRPTDKDLTRRTLGALPIIRPDIPIQPIYIKYTLKEDEVAMEYDIFNTLFGRIYGTYTEDTYVDFEPVTITLNKYDGTIDENLIFSKEITIAKLVDNDRIHWSDQNSKVLYASKELFELFSSKTQFAYGLYFDNVVDLEPIYDIIGANPYTVQSKVYKSIESVGEIVVIFEDFFGLILVTIGLICLSLLVNFAHGNIKKRYYEIGVMKSLGSTTNNIGFIFSLQTIAVGISICILSTISLIIFTPIINTIIATKLLDFVNNDALGELLILSVDEITLIVNIVIIIAVTIITCFLPLLKLRKIKPKNIISSRD